MNTISASVVFSLPSLPPSLSTCLSTYRECVSVLFVRSFVRSSVRPFVRVLSVTSSECVYQWQWEE